ncbi:cysteine protease, YopT-type domain protein, partial [Chlamydia psittaci 03DC35]
MTLPDKISSSHSSRNQSDSFAYHSETSHQNTWPSSNGSSDITLYNSLIKRNNTAED